MKNRYFIHPTSILMHLAEMCKSAGKSPVQIPGCLPKGYTLDSMLTPAQFQTWQQVGTTWFSLRKRKLPGVVCRGRNFVRIHPQTYLDGSIK